MMRLDYDEEMARDYDRLRPHQGERFQFWVDRLIEFGSLGPGMRVLDVGCGTGRFAVPFHELAGASVTGLDMNTSMLARARENDSGKCIDWVEGRAEKLPFRARSFDVVFMVYVIHQIEEKSKVISEAYRVLRPGGRLVLLTSSPHQFRRNPMIVTFPGALEIELARFPKITWLMREYERVGFSGVKRYIRGPGVIEIPSDEFLAWVKAKGISTYHLLGEEQFESGYRVFEKRVRSMGPTVHRDFKGTFVVGRK